MKPESPRQIGLYFALAQVGFEMVVPIILGIFLDDWWGTSPWMVILGAIVGLAGGLWHLVALLNRINKEDPPNSGTPNSST